MPGSYREHAPHPALLPWVECFWTHRAAAGEARAQRVLPDGCVDLLFDRAGRSERAGGRAWLIGTMSRPFELVPAGAVDFVAVRFRPGAAHTAVRDSLAAWTDARIALDELGVWGRALGKTVEDELPVDEHVQRVEALLLERLAHASADAIDRVLRRMEADPAGFRVGRAADDAGISRQWLTRAIRDRSGLGPKELARILRLRRTLDDLPRRSSLASAALAGGYSDQAHLTREARRITGRTPSELRSADHAR